MKQLIFIFVVSNMFGLTQSEDCFPDLPELDSSSDDNDAIEGGSIYYLETLTFRCPGVVTGYRLHTAFQQDQLWAEVLTTTIAVLRDFSNRVVRIGEIVISMNYTERDRNSDSNSNSQSNSGNVDTIQGTINSGDMITVQSGDYLRISSPEPVYSPQMAQFVNSHIPISTVEDNAQRVEHYSGCISQEQCNSLSSTNIRVLIDLVTGEDNFLSGASLGDNTGASTIHSGWIAAIAILILIIVALIAVVFIVIFRKKLRLLVKRPTGEEGRRVTVRAGFHRKDTPSTLADTSPTQTQTGEGGAESDYATIRQNHSVNNRLTAQREEVKYDLPHRGSHSSTMSQDSNENIQPFPDSHVKYCYVPTVEQRSTLSNVHHYEVFESLWTQQNESYKGKPIEDVEVYFPPSEIEDEIYQQMAERRLFEIPRPYLQLTKKIGEGEFGEVYQGKWNSPNGEEEVAIKVLKDGSSEREKIKLLQEAVVMGQFMHPHVVKFYGILTLTDPVMLVLELLPEGDLRNHLMSLRENEHILKSSSTPHMLLSFSHQIAHGMDYLSRKGFVHRDLAARNILLGKDFTCKISDFGMSRDLTGSGYYMTKGGRVPVKWTAPEAILYCKYSTNSDIWSYGMVMYEIWSIGWKPFDSFSIDQVISIINTGYCQPPPPGTPRAIYKLMVQCWNPEPRKRPSFPLLYATLGQPEEKILEWITADKEAGGDGAILGAPLIESLDMFPELQFVYRKS